MSMIGLIGYYTRMCHYNETIAAHPKLLVTVEPT